jgi:hypothetical protein
MVTLKASVRPQVMSFGVIALPPPKEFRERFPSGPPDGFTGELRAGTGHGHAPSENRRWHSYGMALATRKLARPGRG